MVLAATVARNAAPDAADDEADAVHARLHQATHFDVYDVTVSGEGLKLAPVGQHTVFTVHGPGVGAADVHCKISGASTSRFARFLT